MVLLLYPLSRLPQAGQRGLEAIEIEPAVLLAAQQGIPACERLQGFRLNVQLRDAAALRPQGPAIEQQTAAVQRLHRPEVRPGLRQGQGKAPGVHIEVLPEQGPQVDASAVQGGVIGSCPAAVGRPHLHGQLGEIRRLSRRQIDAIGLFRRPVLPVKVVEADSPQRLCLRPAGDVKVPLLLRAAVLRQAKGNAVFQLAGTYVILPHLDALLQRVHGLLRREEPLFTGRQ